MIYKSRSSSIFGLWYRFYIYIAIFVWSVDNVNCGVRFQLAKLDVKFGSIKVV